MAERDEHNESIRRAFAAQSATFDAPGLTLSDRSRIEWMVGSLALPPDATVLDVAAGTGILARALAPHVGAVVASDLTPEMLKKGAQAAAAAGLSNIKFELADAAALPYADESFDAVVSRFAFHHMVDCDAALAEMRRACRAGGKVAVIDLVAPADAAAAEHVNELERLRDPTHTRALSEEEFVALFEGCGLWPVATETMDIAVDVEDWLKLTDTPAAPADTIRAALRAELNGAAAGGMRPHEDAGRLKFTQTWAIFSAVRGPAAVA